MKRRTLLAIVTILALVTLACGPIGGLIGGEGSGGTQSSAEPGGEQPVSPSEPSSGIPEIADLGGLDSYRLHVIWRVQNEDGSEAVEMTVTEEWVREPPASHQIVSISQVGTEEKPVLETITVGDTSWMKADDTWIQWRPEGQENISGIWEDFTTDVEGWTPAGEETVNGIRCKHYTSGGDEISLAIPDPEEGGTVVVGIQGEVWVADQSGLPPVTVRERTQIRGSFSPMPVPGAPSGETGSVYLEYDVTDINTPITIEPPGDAMEMPGLPGETPASPSEAPTPSSESPAPPAGENAAERAADGMVMILIPAGEFLMGSEEWPASKAEKPRHTVYLDEYWIDRTEVTNAQYRLCVEAGVCAAPFSWDDANFNGDAQPVAGVSWEDARTYCEWAGARLPTEAEWEKAARGTDGRIYPWGDQMPDATHANIGGSEDGYENLTAPVGSFPAGASPYGLLDMVGNVREWVADWYGPEYYAHSPAQNPPGPESGDRKVTRGGGYRDDGLVHTRCTDRLNMNPADQPSHPPYETGFRCVMTMQP